MNLGNTFKRCSEESSTFTGQLHNQTYYYKVNTACSFIPIKCLFHIPY